MRYAGTVYTSKKEYPGHVEDMHHVGKVNGQLLVNKIGAVSLKSSLLKRKREKPSLVELLKTNNLTTN